MKDPLKRLDEHYDKRAKKTQPAASRDASKKPVAPAPEPALPPERKQFPKKEDVRFYRPPEQEPEKIAPPGGRKEKTGKTVEEEIKQEDPAEETDRRAKETPVRKSIIDPKLLFLPLVLLMMTLLFFSPALSFVIFAVIAQRYGPDLIPKLILDKLPWFNWSDEISFFLTIIATILFGPLYAFLIIGITFVVHFFKTEVVDFNRLRDYVIINVFLALLTYIIYTTLPIPVLILIPFALAVSKIFKFAYESAFLGMPLISMPRLEEVFGIFIYFAIFSFIGLILGF
jgi:hypothetical protein